MERIFDPLLSLRLQLREGLGRKLKLRQGLPPARQVAGELEFYGLLLARALGAEERAGVGAVWDIGCRNWTYLRALADGFPQASFTGIEVEGGIRYGNLHRRMDLCESHVAALRREGREARAIFRDFLEVSPGAGAVSEVTAFTFFFPFVSESPCRAWGLPSRFADFGALLAHALEFSEAELRFVSAHQGDWEGEIAEAAYRKLGLEPRAQVVAAAEFEGLWPSPHPVYLISASRIGAIR